MTADAAMEIVRCPFCKNTEVDAEGWLDGNGKRGPECLECGATAPDVETWNRSAAPPAPATATDAKFRATVKNLIEGQLSRTLSVELKRRFLEQFYAEAYGDAAISAQAAAEEGKL